VGFDKVLERIGKTVKRDKPPISFALPKSRTTSETRGFRQTVSEIKEGKKEEILRIRETKSSMYTKISGALIRASSLIKLNQFSKHQEFLLVCSDMHDTKGRGLSIPVDLQDVCVKVLYADVKEKTERGIEFWEIKLMQFKARTVELLTPDDCELMKDYTLSCDERR